MKEKLKSLIKKSEKYTKTDMLYVAREGSWLSIGWVVTSTATFLLSIAFANLLPASVYGNYKYVLSVAAIIGGLSLTGINSSLVRSTANGFDGTFMYSFWKRLKWSFPIPLVAFGMAAYYFINANTVLGFSLVIVGILSPFMRALSQYGFFLIGKRDFKRQVGYGIAHNIFTSLVMFLTIVFSDKALIIVFSYFLAHTISIGILFLRTKHVYKPKGEVDPEAISYGAHLSVMNIIRNIANQIDKVLIFTHLGAIELATYTFATAIPDQMRNLDKMIKMLAFPKLSTQNISAIKSSIRRKEFVIFFLVLAIAAAYILVAPFIYKWFFPQYMDSVPFSRLYALSILFFPGTLMKQTLVAHAKTKKLYTLNVVVPIIKIVVLAVALPLYGIWGAVSALLITGLVEFFVALVLFNRLKDDSVSEQTEDEDPESSS